MLQEAPDSSSNPNIDPSFRISNKIPELEAGDNLRTYHQKLDLWWTQVHEALAELLSDSS